MVAPTLDDVSEGFYEDPGLVSWAENTNVVIAFAHFHRGVVLLLSAIDNELRLVEGGGVAESALSGHIANSGADILPSPRLCVESDERFKEIVSYAAVHVAPILILEISNCASFSDRRFPVGDLDMEPEETQVRRNELLCRRGRFLLHHLVIVVIIIDVLMGYLQLDQLHFVAALIFMLFLNYVLRDLLNGGIPFLLD